MNETLYTVMSVDMYGRVFITFKRPKSDSVVSVTLNAYNKLLNKLEILIKYIVF